MSSLNRHLRQFGKLPRSLTRRFMTGLLRALMISNRPERLARAGFVLPTTVLLLLVVTLTAAALTFRAYSRSEQTISMREQRVITNAATPAIDRAKAKIEYLFQKDDRLPGGLPSSDVLAALMIKPGIKIDPSATTTTPQTNYGITSLSEDIYTLPDETRIDINGDNKVDNAWFFKTDINGDGKADDNEVIAYSLLVDDDGNTPANVNKKVTDAESSDKAKALVTRTGPVSTTPLSGKCRVARSPEGGWQIVNSSKGTLQKNFQVDAFVLNRGAGSDINRTAQTLEFQQAREASRGSKWGAWFRYDLEIFPGPEFKWNGAMHSASNIFVQDNIKGYMVSSNDSCIYSDIASEITLADDSDDPKTSNVNEKFQGQFVRGSLKTNTFAKGSNTPEFHYYNGSAVPKNGGSGLQLDDNDPSPSNRDSVTDVSSSTPQDIAVNPITLFTQGVSKPINDMTTWGREASWGINPSKKPGDATAADPVKYGRIYNKTEKKPFVDDFFRADNRWGPNPVYKNYNLRSINAGNSSIVIGKDIDTTTYPGLVDGEGLDGYWERQAIATGTRVIVGQRLELGNNNGWNVNPSNGNLDPTAGDPLYPPNQVVGSSSAHPNVPGNDDTQKKYPGGGNEVLQRRALRDNLAAVQGMVAYHYTQGTATGQYPAACMAMTAHPGTPTTIKNSRTFSYYPGTSVLNTSFLTGTGTDGWEFSFYDESTFESSIASGQPLGKALRNLAYFAGDPKGGAPSFEPIQDGIVHPYPYFSMWGDFSPLRRIFNDYLDKSGGLTYSQLSPADKATLHSAACTLGILAYNLDNASSSTILGKAFDNISTNQGQLFTKVGKPIWDWFSPSANAQSQGCTYNSAGNGTYTCYNLGLSKEEILAASGLDAAGLKLVQIISDLFQVDRDRTYGFQSTPTSTPANPFTAGGQGNKPTYKFNFPNECDPRNSTGLVGKYINSNGNGNLDEQAGIALVCSTIVKYPSLYYLFPKANHDHDGPAAPDPTAQPVTTEEYVNPAKSPYIFNPSGTDKGVNATYTYQAVEPSAIKLTPQAIANWKTPIKAAGVAFDNEAMHIVDTSGTVQKVAFLDMAFFDAREQLNVRALNLDIDLLTDASEKIGGDYWISASKANKAEGVVFAFREDAVREDEIVRPKNSDTSVTANYCAALVSNVTNPKKFNLTNDVNCRMRVEPGTTPVFQDPPLTSAKISLKPVDFYPDPERRPYGFRFVNGQDISDGKARSSGMTFVTDNSVYIQGNFNLHSNDGTTTGIIEEFTSKLSSDPSWGVSQFYTGSTGRNASALNTDNFANLTVDYWRPVEILADAVGILSPKFMNGSVADTFLMVTPATDGGGGSSYQNQNRPYFTTAGAPYTADNWIQENEWVGATATVNSGAALTPVWVDRNGKYALKNAVSGAITGWTIDQFTSFGNNALRKYNLITADTATVNATIISGLIPSRPFQSYGGLHNFPRFLESWDKKALNIAGAFLQLNFSTAATGPFDQDAWERGEDPVSDEFIVFYVPPDRRWGYDVALQYVPPAPVSRRFISYGLPRSQYYRELPVDDSYVMRLRCAYIDSSNTVRVDPTVTDAQCSA